MRSIQATPQYMPFILRNSDIANSKSSGSWPYLKGKEGDRKGIMPEKSYFAIKLACWSIIREVGAFAGITASFTITAIVV